MIIPIIEIIPITETFRLSSEKHETRQFKRSVFRLSGLENRTSTHKAST